MTGTEGEGAAGAPLGGRCRLSGDREKDRMGRVGELRAGEEGSGPDLAGDDVGAAQRVDVLPRTDGGRPLHHDTHLPTLICWQMIGFDNTLCVGNCTTLLKTRKLSAMMLYGYELIVGISLRTMKLLANVFRQNKCRHFINKPTV